MRKPFEWEVNKNGCWVCTSHSKTKEGYPQCEFDGQRYYLSRYIYMQCFGEIPENMLVCHKCDNPQCINPEHFFLGTHKDNMQDMVMKGRNNPMAMVGERNGQAKLTAQQVINILNSTQTYRTIAAKYGVSKAAITNIKTRKSWRNITPELYMGKSVALKYTVQP